MLQEPMKNSSELRHHIISIMFLKGKEVDLALFVKSFLAVPWFHSLFCSSDEN